MLTSLKYILKNNTPRIYGLLKKIRYPAYPVPFGLMVLNIIVQRFFRINGCVPWMVHFTSSVNITENIQIGKKVWQSFAISGNCYIQGGNGIIIGDNTIFGPGVKIISANHDPHDLDRWVVAEPVQIGKNCWIGANAVILPSVKLGNNCIVGAGAVVNKSFPDNSILVGVPAKNIA